MSNVSVTPTDSDLDLVVNLGLLEMIVGTISFLCMVVCNSFVVYFVATSWRQSQYRNVPNLLVLSLAVADLLTGLLGYPLRLLSCYAGSWLGGAPTCYVNKFILTTLANYSECIVVVMGIERYISIGKPFFYEKHCSLRHFYITLAVLFLYSLFIGTLDILSAVFSEIHLTQPKYNIFCYENQGKQTVFSKVFKSWIFTQGFILVWVMLFCNVSVTRSIRELEHRMEISCPKSREEYLRQKDLVSGISREFSRLMTAINVTFIVCIAPRLLRIFCNLIHVWPSVLADFVCWRVSLSNAWINPLIYGLLRRRFRLRLKRGIVKLCPCLRSNKVIIRPDVEDDNGLNTCA